MKKLNTYSLWAAISAGFMAALGQVSVAWAQAGGAVEPTEAPPEWRRFLVEAMRLDVFNIELWRVGLALLLLFLGFGLRGFILEKLLAPVRTIVERTETTVDDQILVAIRGPLGWVINLAAVYVALLVLAPPAAVLRVSVLIMQTVGTGLVAWVVFKLIDVGAVAVAAASEHKNHSAMERQLIPLVVRVLRVVLFVLVAITLIQQWGYDVTSLIAGLGIGGLAFALAAKPTLSNWFGSAMIFSDQPFKVGDWVSTTVGQGIVEDVGLRSTRIRTFSDTLITVPNADIATTAVENCSAMKSRRIRTHIRLVYSTTRQQMDQILEQIKQRVREDSRIDDDTWRIYFDDFGPDSLNLLVQCWSSSTAYVDYMQVKQELFLDIMQIVEDAQSQFALPSRQVYMQERPE